MIQVERYGLASPTIINSVNTEEIVEPYYQKGLFLIIRAT
jgi:hypothetical protein